jgi:hypothetical protein
MTHAILRLTAVALALVPSSCGGTPADETSWIEGRYVAVSAITPQGHVVLPAIIYAKHGDALERDVRLDSARLSFIGRTVTGALHRSERTRTAGGPWGSWVQLAPWDVDAEWHRVRFLSLREIEFNEWHATVEGGALTFTPYEYGHAVVFSRE